MGMDEISELLCRKRLETNGQQGVEFWLGDHGAGGLEKNVASAERSGGD